jgi:hypothetical protein
MEKRKNRREQGLFFPLAFLFLFTAACAAPLTDIAPDYSTLKPTRIAVLPVMNDTSDLDAPTVFRILAQAELADKGYRLLDFSRIDEGLRAQGIQEAGQIESLTPQEIGELLKADGLLYTRVLGYGRQVGVHIKMEGSFTLISARSGEKIWYSELGVFDDIALEGGAIMLGAELLGGKDARKKALAAYLAARQARTAQAVAKFRSHSIRSEVFRVITVDLEKIPLLDQFFSKNFRSLPPG